jgi:hypothetical protein
MAGRKPNPVPGKVELLFGKLSRPIHYSYIARYILNESNEQTLETLQKLTSLGLLEESKYSQGYFVNSTGPSGPSSF